MYFVSGQVVTFNASASLSLTEQAVEQISELLDMQN